MLRKFIFSIIIIFSFSSCELIEFLDYIYDEIENTNYDDFYYPDNEAESTPEPAPQNPDSIEYIQYKALEYAKMYCNEDTVYVYGAQDPIPRVLRVDCSGMVINCYKYAIEETQYKLPFDDTNAANLHSTYSYPTDTPQPGDMIFLGETNSSSVTHIGIFEKKVGNTIYFIDATEGKGVSQRSYDKSNSKIKGYGQIKLVQK